MFGLGMPELILVAVVALLLFGPKRLPELGKSLGRSIAAFKEGMREAFPSENQREGVAHEEKV
jgi:sec-independent protein translocase protein TatA